MALYPYAYIFKGRKTVLLWETSGKPDSFKLDMNGQLIQSSSIEELKKRLPEQIDDVHWDEYAEINFDKFWVAIRNLRKNRASSKKTCEILLNGWNFIEDMGRTFQQDTKMKRLKTKVLNKAYDKIFAGNNLPAVTPEGRSYSPLWTKNEMKAMRNCFKNVWSLFITNGYIN
jgi:hypothetical protein